MIKFSYDNTEYRLGFNRKTALATEKLGFSFTKLEDMPVNTTWALFKGSFLMNHPMTNEDKVAEIFSKISDKEGLAKALYEEFMESIQTLAGDSEGNVMWTKE